MDDKSKIAEHYKDVAVAAAEAGGCGCCGDETGSEAARLYSDEILEGIPAETLAASRGCGDPVAIAGLQPGERVLDLGSGGGIDALIAARLVGEEGFVRGLDMVPEMVELARKSADAAGISNVEFVEGDITAIPLEDGCVDVVISNCVINLCPDKAAVFKEASRVLAPGGRMVVSDIVAFEPIPSGAYEALCAITGCRNGIPDAAFYEEMLRDCGFNEVALEPKTVYTLDVLREKAARKHHEESLPAVENAGAYGITGSVIVRASIREKPSGGMSTASPDGR